jgi:hypothetical protein
MERPKVSLSLIWRKEEATPLDSLLSMERELALKILPQAKHYQLVLIINVY